MRVKSGLAAAALLLSGITETRLAAQTTPPGPPAGRRRFGGLVPGQQRPPGDPAQIERGKTLYGVSCTGCHGADLRGGDLGGPNLLRSQVALSDQDGGLIIPIILGSRQNMGMPAIPMSEPDAKAVATYVRSVIANIGNQGRPPSVGQAAPSILVGDAGAGRAYFAAKCGTCHSATQDLQGIGTRISDPKMLQNTWVAGGGRVGRGPAAQSTPNPRVATAVVTSAAGQTIEGRLVRIDDFFVTVGLADGSVRTFPRDGDVPKVEIRDPLKSHRDLLAVYTDKDIHDVTAYLVSLK